MYIPRVAKFWGKHNRTKSLVFITLCECRDFGDERKFSALEIFKMCSLVPYGTIRNCLPKWFQWGYLLADTRIKPKFKDHKLAMKYTSIYKASAKARHYVDNIPEPAISRYRNMLYNWRMKQEAARPTS